MEDFFGILIFIAFMAFSAFGRVKKKVDQHGQPPRPMSQPGRAQLPPQPSPPGRAAQPQPATRNWPAPPLQPNWPPPQPSQQPQPAALSRSGEGVSLEGRRSEGFGSGEGPEATERLKDYKSGFAQWEDHIPDQYETTDFGSYDGLKGGLEYQPAVRGRRQQGIAVDIQDNLTNPDRVAEAIVLAEVLGPPLAKRRPGHRRI